MLSLGTDCPLAFAIASARVGLPAGSPPPVRAATSIVLISLANSLPRLASTTAFLCLVVAHFEWPLTLLLQVRLPPSLGNRAAAALPHEQLVQPLVARQLGMEGRRKQPLMPYGDRVA